MVVVAGAEAAAATAALPGRNLPAPGTGKQAGRKQRHCHQTFLCLGFGKNVPPTFRMSLSSSIKPLLGVANPIYSRSNQVGSQEFTHSLTVRQKLHCVLEYEGHALDLKKVNLAKNKRPVTHNGGSTIQSILTQARALSS